MITLLLACTPAPDDSGPVVADTADTASLSPAASTPEWSADEAAEALTAAISQGLPESETLRDWFLNLIISEAVDDESCYTIVEADDSMSSGWWEGICTGASGYQFKGGWLYQQIETTDGDATSIAVSLLASFEGQNPDGTRDVIGGTLSIQRARPADDQVQFSQECGGKWTAPNQADWLGDGVGLGLSMSGMVNGGMLQLTIEGGAAYSDGSYLYFHGLNFEQSTCGQAPMGEVWIRDPSGIWLVFDFGTACDGCAQVSALGEDWGEQCVGDPVWVAAANAVARLAAED